jgi:hypothetical protein
MRPPWLRQYLSKEYIRIVGVVKAYSVCVLRIVGGGVDVSKRILRLRLRAVLRNDTRLEVLVGFVRCL